MNGRIYDPTLGRFLQADPFIQAPSNSQSYNRYSYVLNNPMSYTDPSGYFFSGLAKKVGRKFIRSAVKIFGAKAVNIVGTFVATYFGNAYGAAAWTYEFNRAMGVSSSGALRASAVAFVAASIPAANTGNAFSNFVVDGVVGGSISYASGGNFGHGFWSAGLNSAVGGGNVSSNAFVNVVSSAVIGGTISKVTGGKFANGASSAAFSSAMRQDWSIPPKEGSAEWNAREEAYFQKALAQDMAMTGNDLYANVDWNMIGNFIYDEGFTVVGRTFSIVGGAGQIALGAGLCATALGCALGAPIAVLGTSSIQEGWTGGNGFVREGAQAILGQTYGDYTVGALNLATSLGGLARPVLTPIPTSSSRPLFRNISYDFSPAVTQATRVGLYSEGSGSILNLSDTYSRTH
nr:RHS repeat-associated core domain-containing protein [Pseudoalteromonas sp. NBT06-2]